MGTDFTPEEIEKCKAAMSKPAPRQALEAIAGGILVELTKDRRDMLVTYRGERMFLGGAWPLYRAGMVDEFGCVTDAGHAYLQKGKTDER